MKAVSVETEPHRFVRSRRRRIPRPSSPGRLAVAVVVACILPATAVRAQDVSARDRQGAAEAYDRGTSALLRHDYARAAHWFETANRLAPAKAALVQAVRANERAGNELRAATLALRLRSLYPNDAAAQRTAQHALSGASRFFRVDVECDGCSVMLDGRLSESPSFFLEPDQEHQVTASFETGNQSETVRGEAGATRTLTFEAPPEPESEPPAEENPPADEEPTPTPTPPEPPAEGGGGVPLWLTISAMVVTAAVGGTLIWSTIDMYNGVPAYKMHPTLQGLHDGQAREARTEWLIGGTAVAAVATILLAIFTDWGGGGGETPPPVQPTVSFQRNGFAAGLRGRY